MDVSKMSIAELLYVGRDLIATLQAQRDLVKAPKTQAYSDQLCAISSELRARQVSL